MNEIEYKDFISMYKLTDLIGAGSTSECYKISETEVFKKFYDDYTISDKDEKYKMIKEFSYIELDGICFPKILVKNSGLLVGEVSSYAKGKTIRNICEDELLSNFIDALNRLEKSIELLSNKYKITLSDLNGSNMIYGYDFSLIDTGEYYFDYFNKLLKSNNFHILNSNVIMYLIGTNNFMDFSNNAGRILDNSINDLYMESIFYGLQSLSIYLCEYIKYLESKVDMEINFVGDLRNGTRKLINTAK